jgi:hypothetical protein
MLLKYLKDNIGKRVWGLVSMRKWVKNIAKLFTSMFLILLSILLMFYLVGIAVDVYWKSAPEKSTYNEEHDVSIEVYRGHDGNILFPSGTFLALITGEGYFMVIHHQGQTVRGDHGFIEGIDDLEFSEIEYKDKGNALLVVNGFNGDTYAVFDKPDRPLTEKEGET